MRKMRIAALAAAMCVSVVAASKAQTKCDRACLTGFVDRYFEGLLAHKPDVVPLAANAKITKNGKVASLRDNYWENAERTIYRWDIVNERLGDTGTEAIVQNKDGSKTMLMLRLKVKDGKISEVEVIKANKGDAGGLWGADQLTTVSPALQLSIRESERDSYYRLISVADGYFRAFQTNGTKEYRPAELLPDCKRFENGVQTTGLVRNGKFASTAQGFDEGAFIGRNLWDRRYPVVDEERGIAMSILRFGMKEGMKSQSAATANDRLVAEFFAIKSGMIQEITAVLVNIPDSEPTGWEPWYGPGRGGR